MNTSNLPNSLVFFCAGMTLAFSINTMLPSKILNAATQTVAVEATAPASAPTTTAGTSLTAASAPAASPTPLQTTAFPARTKVTSTVIDSTKLRTTVTASGKRADVFNGPSGTLQTFESHITTVDPGKSAHDPHIHPHEEMLIVKEGKLEVTLAGKTYIAEPGSIIFYGPNDPHGTKSVGTVPAVYYVFSWVTEQTPRPDVTTPAPKS